MKGVVAFTKRQLQRTVDVFNAYLALARLVEIGLDEEELSFSLPFDGGAVLAQVFSNDTAEVTVVGGERAPRQALEQMAMLCAAIGATWRAEGWSTSSLEGACVDLINMRDGGAAA